MYDRRLVAICALVLGLPAGRCPVGFDFVEGLQ